MSDLIIEKIQRISSGHAHCAFTDLIACPFNADRLLCTYREAQHHMSEDGHIEVAVLSTTGTVMQRQRLRLPGWDLRDPQFSVDDQRTLWLTAYAKSFNPDGTVQKSANVSWFSTTGTSWSSMHWFGENRWWLWRLAWHDGQAYSLGYQRKANRLDLFAGHPRKQMHRLKPHVLSKRVHAAGFPSETELYFDNTHKMWALARRDGDTMTAKLGAATPPYTRWRWTDLGIYIGGPAWLPFTQETMLVCGRDFDGNQVATKLWLLHKPSARLQVLARLPSGGDTSYPGMVLNQDSLFVSYYSSHIDNTTRVYLATLRGINALRNVVKEREISDARK